MTRGPQSSSSVQILTAVQRRRKALELRLKGQSLRTIAAAVGVKTEGAVSRMLSKELARAASANLERAGELRALQLEQIGAAKEKLLTILATHVDADEISKASSALVKVLDREAKLMGLDESVVGDGTPQEIIVRIADNWQG